MKCAVLPFPVLIAALGLLTQLPMVQAQVQALDDLPLATLPQIGAGPALIIAVDQYDSSSPFGNLPGIDKDAETVRATLRTLGFSPSDITVLKNPTKDEMLSAMNRFGELAAATRKTSFVYFTGHGVLMDGRNYLIPSRAPIRVQGHLATYAVPIEHVLGYLGGEDSGPALVFVDACRDNTLPRTGKNASSPVALQRQPGLFIGYATGEGRISNASEQGSIFTLSLCKRLLTPGRSVDDIYAGVIHDVQRETADARTPQDPQKQSALRFVFHLVPGSSGPVSSVPSQPAMSEAEIQKRIEEEVKRRMAAGLGEPQSRSAPQPGKSYRLTLRSKVSPYQIATPDELGYKNWFVGDTNRFGTNNRFELAGELREDAEVGPHVTVRDHLRSREFKLVYQQDYDAGWMESEAPGVVAAVPSSGASVLGRIASFKAPPYPKDGYGDRETYDYRIMHGKANPATLEDTLICDVWQRVQMDLKLQTEPGLVTEDVIFRALNVYMNVDWKKIAGYRPFTHLNFVRGLKDEDRQALAREIAEFLRKRGVPERNGD